MHCGRQDLSQKKKKTAIRFLILSFFSSSFLCLFDGVVGGGRWFVVINFAAGFLPTAAVENSPVHH